MRKQSLQWFSPLLCCVYIIYSCVYSISREHNNERYYMSVKKMNSSCIFIKVDNLLISYNFVCIDISVPFAQDVEDN